MTYIQNDITNLVTQMAKKYGISKDSFFELFKREVFKNECLNTEPTEKDILQILIAVSCRNLNPIAGDVYAAKNDFMEGFALVLTYSGWLKIVNSHKEFDGVEFKYSQQEIRVNGESMAVPEWCECTIYRKDRKIPITIREYAEEVYKGYFVNKQTNETNATPWQKFTKRMLRHKTFEQCARLSFSLDDLPLDFNHEKNLSNTVRQELTETNDEFERNSSEQMRNKEIGNNQEPVGSNSEIKLTESLKSDVATTMDKALNASTKLAPENRKKAILGFISERFTTKEEREFAINYSLPKLDGE